MKNIRLTAAILASRMTSLLCRLIGKNGASVPGKIARKICPDILSLLAKQVKGDIIAVCGTNGKTTTCNLLYNLLSSQNYKVVCNSTGANLIDGICYCFIKEASVFGKLKADFAVLEVDEATSPKVFPQVLPDKMLITNLFRDQLDRYGEIDATAGYIKKALELSPDTELILNGDDPLCAQFGKLPDRKSKYICVDEDAGVSVNEVREGQFCVFCGEKLNYEYYHYSQLGKYSCPGCDFKRPEPDFKVHDIKLSDGISFTMDYFGKSKKFVVPYRGFYNIYNIALSYAAAYLAIGDDVKNAGEVYGAYEPQTGRMEEFKIDGKTVVLNLSKNPAGFNQTIAAFASDKDEKVLLIGINDNAGDGKDVSWIWDVDFERLNTIGAKKIVIAGIRVDDLAVRLKYAGLDRDKIEIKYSLDEAADAMLNQDCDKCYALVNYTVVYKLQEILKELEKKNG